MPSLLLPRGNLGWMPADLELLAAYLTEGKPTVGWRGDPRLGLEIGIIRDRLGNVVAKRLEIWRACEDGKDRRITHFKITEVSRNGIDWVLRELVKMDPRTPGHVDAATQMDAADEANEKARKDALREHLGPMLEHAHALAYDRESGGRRMHGQAGIGDGKMTRQRRRAAQRASGKDA